MNEKKTIVAYLSWLGTSAFVIICALVQDFPFPTRFLKAENTLFILVEAQIFFLLFLWPLLLPPLAECGTGASPRPSSGNVPSSSKTADSSIPLAKLFVPSLHLLFLVVISLPLIWVSQKASNMDFGASLRFVIVFGLLGVVVSGVNIVRGKTGELVAGCYFALAFFISACVPFIHYVTSEFLNVDLSFLAAFSPFWCALIFVGGGEGAKLSFIPLVFYAAIAVTLMTWSTVPKRAAAQDL